MMTSPIKTNFQLESVSLAKNRRLRCRLALYHVADRLVTYIGCGGLMGLLLKNSLLLLPLGPLRGGMTSEDWGLRFSSFF